MSAWSTIAIPFDMTSTKMNASTPTENIASATRARLSKELEPPYRQTKEDRESGEGAEGNGLGKRHRTSFWIRPP